MRKTRSAPPFLYSEQENIVIKEMSIAHIVIVSS